METKHFIGYHGTSEESAQNILNAGIQERRLGATGQIGRGFYVARMNGTLPHWGAEQATAEARSKLPYFVRMVSLLTGEVNNPLIGIDARRTILKIYALQPLVGCKWNIMNPPDLNVLKILRYDNGGPGLAREDLELHCQWLQMVVPPDQLQYLRAERDDGIFERPKYWLSKEYPF
jgi:hypothetical protein